MKDFKIFDVRVNPGDSAFLADDGKTAILYDSGFGFTGYGIAENIKNILGTRKLDYIFLTHSHYDHVLGAVYVKKYWKDARVFAGEYAAKIFAKPSARAVMRDLDKKIAARCGVSEYEDLIDELAADVVLSDGEKIAAGDNEFVALSLPGHTKCSMGYYCPERKLLLCSETVGVFNGKDNVVPSYLVGYDMTIKSIERVKKLDIENILIPHFGLVGGELAEFYLEKAAESAVCTAKEITDMLRAGKTKEEAVEFFKNKFCKGHMEAIYPPDAMEMNTGITVELLKREFGV